MIDILTTYKQQIAAYPVLPTPEQQHIARAAHNGDTDARQRLIQHNLALVITIARRYPRAPMSLLDRIQEGNIGLIKAADGYDPDSGVLFSTYAGSCIQRNIERAVYERGSLIPLPVYLADAGKRIRAAARELASSLGRTPTREEIRAAVRLSRSIWFDAYFAAAAIQQISSLDTPLTEDDPTTLLDVLPGDDLADTTHIGGALCEAWRELSDEQRNLIALTAGLDDEPVSIKQAAAHLGVSWARARRVHSEGRAMLRTYGGMQ